MGQKVHPYGFRLGYNKNWKSRWYSKKEYPAFVYEDDKIRKYVKKALFHAGIASIELERAGGKVRLILSTARPGIVTVARVLKSKSSALTFARSSTVSSPSKSTRSVVLKLMPSWWQKALLSSLSAVLPSVAP